MSAHTPGPWVVLPERESRPLGLRSLEVGLAVGREIATVWESQPVRAVELGHVAPCVDADAGLIAAAPDLLAACEEVAEFLSRGRCRCTLAEIESGHHVDCWKPETEAAAEKARAAIAKARGNTIAAALHDSRSLRDRP